jgi:hypothetical protein
VCIFSVDNELYVGFFQTIPFFPNPNLLQWPTSPILDPSMVRIKYHSLEHEGDRKRDKTSFMYKTR